MISEVLILSLYIYRCVRWLRLYYTVYISYSHCILLHFQLRTTSKFTGYIAKCVTIIAKIFIFSVVRGQGRA